MPWTSLILRPEEIRMRFDKITQSISEQLYGDEKLRSNLADDEAKVVLDWAVHWIEEQMGSAKDESSAKQLAQRALARVRPVISAINAFAAHPGELRLSDVVATLEPLLVGNQKLSRPQVFGLLTILAGATWQVQSEDAKRNR
jgi:hypothetical protein